MVRVSARTPEAILMHEAKRLNVSTAEYAQKKVRRTTPAGAGDPYPSDLLQLLEQEILAA